MLNAEKFIEGVNTMQSHPQYEEYFNAMNSLGLDGSLIGFSYIIYAEQLIESDPSYLQSVTKRLYPDVAKMFGSTGSRVERAIRHAVEVCFKVLSPDVIEGYFGNCDRVYTGEVTNTQFLSIVSDRTKIAMRKEGKL